MERLSFKQYLASKEQLLKAVEHTPVTVVEYEVVKYCSLVVGETEEDKQLIGLKPKNHVLVEWKYTNPLDPTPEKLWVRGSKNVDDDQDLVTFWSGAKLSKWLQRHATKDIT